MKVTKKQLEKIIRKEIDSHLNESEVELEEKKKKKKKKKKSDRCTKIAKRRYKVWPSAYASGAVVKCRKGKIWKGVKEGKKFEPHDMFNPKTGEKIHATKEQEHLDLGEKGYTHVDPDELRKILKDEGGASGLDPFIKAIGDMEDEIKKTLDAMPDVGQHEDGDYILDDEKSIDVVEEKKKKKKKKKTDYSKEKESGLHGWFSRAGGKGKSKGWVDCNTCRKDKKTGKKTCKSCGRKEGEKRSKYPACRPTPSDCGTKGKGKKWGKKSSKKESLDMKLTKSQLEDIIRQELNSFLHEDMEGEYYEVDAVSENEEYCPVCVVTLEEKKKPCKPSKGKRFAKRVNGKCRSYGQAGKAKDGGDRIRPGTKKADAYCARSAKIKKCKNPPCANTLSRKKWKCRGSKSVA
jgi:hypothetical protein